MSGSGPEVGAGTGEVVEPAAPRSLPAHALTRLRARWATVPLRLRLVGVVTGLLLVGLVLAGVATLTLLGRTLVDQVDAQLTNSARELAKQTWFPDRAGDDDDGRPTDYFVRWATVDGETIRDISSASSDSAPQLPELTVDEVHALGGEPFTVTSEDGGTRWRVVELIPVADQVVQGTVAVALPLTSADATMAQMRWTLLGISVAVLLLGALVGRVAVRRSLRPLRQIEDTAAAIAAGDLSQRIPSAPLTTEVGRLGGALNAMLTQIEHAFAERTASEGRMRRFVADASHELRTPLAAIRGYSELYRMGALSEPAQVDDTMHRIEQSSIRMGGLVEDLLALARLDERRPPRTEEVDLTVLAADAVSDLHALDPDRPVRLRALDDAAVMGSCTVRGDERMIRQVLSNLVGNVVAHTPAGTLVEIAVGMLDGAGVLEVRDHGPGIDPEHAARVFERFYRIDASRTRGTGGSGSGGGAGLGMAIVAAIVAAHGGTVAISETPGGGTTVTVALPADASPVPRVRSVVPGYDGSSGEASSF